MRKLLYLLPLLCAFQVNAQTNCSAYLYAKDTLKFRACKTIEKKARGYQFSRRFQEGLDAALEIDSTYAEAYKIKSTAYLKSGDFITWMQLMNKAVEYDPAAHLNYRGWCRYQFFRDYKGAIADIDLLDELVPYDIGYSQNGDYHLHVAKALCYKALGEREKAIELIEKHFKTEGHFVGVFDYIHLGVLYMEMGNYEKAIQAFKKQEIENDLAENRYYIAKAYKILGNNKKFLENMNLAKEKYETSVRMMDPYVQQMDKIFLDDIEEELSGI